MSSAFGKNIRISIFGQSHSPAIGTVIDGLPAGKRIDLERLGKFLARRAPGQNEYSTPRREADVPEILSGIKDGLLCGAPLSAIIRNHDTDPSAYAETADRPRPGHADFTARMKHSEASDFSGGGHFSGRLTAPLCIAGGIMIQLLEQEGIDVGAHISEIAGVLDAPFDPVSVSVRDLERVRNSRFPVMDNGTGDLMRAAIMAAGQAGDSVGGVIECAVLGLSPGVGEPMFEGLENIISAALFAVPAVKGVEFGSGFAGSRSTGSKNNDPFACSGGKITTHSNSHGGILGGISTGMPVIFRAAIKPTPSIGIEQDTISFSKMENVRLRIKGRHDPCIVPRAVPCVEAAAAIAVYDSLLSSKIYI